ncbi:MAG: F0F1 ATP synthase subunit epsilon [Flavobacteriia bacterium]|jgi:F-type H+-transporting ATPase subunit epsilon|nr:F0F1 ATP synthase subunit epsilon [Flavobacteriia bacterium]
MKLNVITPTAKIFDGEVISVSLPGQDGIFQVLNNHTAIISSLTIGEVIIELVENTKDASYNEMIQIKDQNHIIISIKGGVAELINNELIILAE